MSLRLASSCSKKELNEQTSIVNTWLDSAHL